jgi:hypothetical protein
VAGLKQDLNSKRADHTAKNTELTQKSTLLKHNETMAFNLSARISELRSPTSSHAKVIAIAKARREEDMASDLDSVVPEDLETLDINEFLGSLETDLKAIVVDMELFSQPNLHKIMKRLKKLSKKVDADGSYISLECPCCMRSFGDDDNNFDQDGVIKMNNSIKMLGTEGSPLIKVGSDSEIQTKAAFTERVETVKASLGDWDELKRAEKEREDIKKVIASDTANVESYETEAVSLEREIVGIEAKLTDVESVRSEVVKLRDTGTRVSDKQAEVEQKKVKWSEGQMQ